MAKKTTDKKIKIAISIRPSVLKEVDRLAAQAGRSRSDYIERILADQTVEDAAIAAVLSNKEASRAMADFITDRGIMQALGKAFTGGVSKQEFKKAEQVLRDAGSPHGTKPKNGKK